MKWKMKTVIEVRDGGSDHDGVMHWLKLECGHIVTPYWDYETHYTPGKTKARCYKCAEKSNPS